MATYSELMNLILPEKTDPYSIDHFNQNFTKLEKKTAALDTTMAANKQELLQILAVYQKKLDAAKYNEYRQFLAQKYQNPSASANGYHFDIFQNDSGQDKTQTADGFKVEGSTLKMWYTPNVITMGTTNNKEFVIGWDSESGDVPGYFWNMPKTEKFQSGKASITVYAKVSHTPASVQMMFNTNNGVNITKHIPLSTGYQACTLEITVPQGEHTLGSFSVVSNVRHEVVLQGENKSGPFALHDGQSLVGNITLPNGRRATDYFYTTGQTTASNFTSLMLYARAKLNVGDSLSADVSLDNGSSWQSFYSPSISDTTNNSGVACKELKFVLGGLPSGNRFKLRFQFQRSNLETSPELYDYGVVQES